LAGMETANRIEAVQQVAGLGSSSKFTSVGQCCGEWLAAARARGRRA
jgi:hypothetical protein